MRCYIVDSAIGEFQLPAHTYVLPIMIQIENETYVEDRNFDKKLLETALENKQKINTSQPNIGTTIQLFEEIKDQYDEFVLILTGAKISGTYDTCVSAAQQTGLNFIAIDSFGAGPNMKFLMDLALNHAEMPLEELRVLLEARACKAEGIVIPGSLERLKLSGRVSTLQMMIGELLRVTPVFVLKNGVLEVYKKERTRKKAYNTLLNYIEEHANGAELTILEYKFEDRAFFEEKLNPKNITEMHAALLAHLGNNSIGILWN